MGIPESPHTAPAPWSNVARLSRAKLIRRATLYFLFGIGLILFLRTQNYRISTRFFDNDRIIPWFFVLIVFYCVFEAISLLWLLPAGRCFIRAGREGIWYKQPPGGYPLGPAKEVRILWSDVKRWTPFRASMNGITHTQFIAFETLARDTRTIRKHVVFTHPYQENQDQIVANIQAVIR